MVFAQGNVQHLFRNCQCNVIEFEKLLMKAQKKKQKLKDAKYLYLYLIRENF